MTLNPGTEGPPVADPREDRELDPRQQPTFRRRLFDPDRTNEGPRAAILFVFGIIALVALLLTSSQTTISLSTVSGST